LAPDAPARAGALDLRYLQAVLLDELADTRAEPAFGGRFVNNFGPRLRRGLGISRHGRVLGGSRRAFDLQLGERRPDRHRLSGRDPDAHQAALDGGGDLGIHLVGDDLDDRLVAPHDVALLLEPAVDSALGYRFAELRHFERGQAHRAAVIPRWILVAVRSRPGLAAALRFR